MAKTQWFCTRSFSPPTGTYDEYIWSMERRLASGNLKASPALPDKSSATAPGPATRKDRDKRIRQLEREITKFEDQLHRRERENLDLNQQIAAGSGNVSELVERMSANSIEIQELESRWLALAEELSVLKGDR